MKRFMISAALFLFVVSAISAGAQTTPKKDEPKNPLVGSWYAAADNLKVEIRANGTLTINGEEYLYKVKGSVISVVGEDGALSFPFVLEGDTLTVDHAGREIVYKRIKPGTRAVAGAESSSSSSSGDAALMQALVGKWCYMSSMSGTNSFMSSRCFVLYANGTYEYSAENSTSGAAGGTNGQSWDSGRWSATRTTLTAYSNSQGKITYPIELRNHPKTGDPMIVVDGDAYVTAYQKRPW